MSKEADFKYAADAIRLLPKLAKENQELKLKVAKYERKDRLDKIAQALIDKKQIGDHERGIKIAELDRLHDVDLDRIEAGLSVISSAGSLSLGEVEQRPGPDSSRGETGLHRLLMTGDPENY